MEHALRVSEEKFARAFRVVPISMAVLTATENRLLDVNDTWVRYTGYRREDAVGRTLLELNLFDDPADVARINRHMEANGGTLHPAEYRFRMREGRIVIGSLSIGEFHVEGEALRIAAIADVTAMRRADEAPSRVTRALISAQERERLRIARDLHDDLGQRMALLQVGIELVREDIPLGMAKVLGQVDALSGQAVDIANDIRTLSHNLHAGTLRILSIDQALKALCTDARKQLHLDIEFSSHDVSTPVGTDRSLCLFRVLQEALTNAAKHSGTSRVEVELWETEDTIHLRVRDFGKGLSSMSASEASGLGLIIMRERVGMVDGTFSITSTPNVGTEIVVGLPLAAVSADTL